MCTYSMLWVTTVKSHYLSDKFVLHFMLSAKQGGIGYQSLAWPGQGSNHQPSNIKVDNLTTKPLSWSLSLSKVPASSLIHTICSGGSLHLSPLISIQYSCGLCFISLSLIYTLLWAVTVKSQYLSDKFVLHIRLYAECQSRRHWVPVFGMTRSGIEPQPSNLKADTLTTRPLS